MDEQVLTQGVLVKNIKKNAMSNFFLKANSRGVPHSVNGFTPKI
jgi:hypothetical protein